MCVIITFSYIQNLNLMNLARIQWEIQELIIRDLAISNA